MVEIRYRTLTAIEEKVCDIAAHELNIPRNKISPASRLIEDLHCDSLDLVELIMAIEDQIAVTIPTTHEANAVCKAVFTRKEFRLSDLAEIAYLQQDTGRPEPRDSWRRKRKPQQGQIDIPFCQLGGCGLETVTSHSLNRSMTRCNLVNFVAAQMECGASCSLQRQWKLDLMPLVSTEIPLRSIRFNSTHF